MADAYEPMAICEFIIAGCTSMHICFIASLSSNRDICCSTNDWPLRVSVAAPLTVGVLMLIGIGDPIRARLMPNCAREVNMLRASGGRARRHEPTESGNERRGVREDGRDEEGEREEERGEGGMSR